MIPCQRLLAREVAFDHRAAATFNRFALFGGDRTVFHIRKGDYRPYGFTFIFKGINFRHAGGDFVAKPVEHCLQVTDLGP